MADKRRDWGMWGFWVAIAAVLVGASAAEYEAHNPAWGHGFLIAGLFVGGLCVLAVILPSVFTTLSKVSQSALGALRWIGRAIARIYVGSGTFLLRPIVEPITRRGETSDWTAGLRKLTNEHGCYDYRVLALEHHRLVNARFVMFPDYSCKTWIAGFALSSSPLDFNPGDRTGKVLCYLESQKSVGTKILCRRDKEVWGYGVQSGNYERSSFEFGLTTFPEQAPGRLALRMTIDGSPAGQLDSPTEYARYLILFAWVNGGDFRVDFTQIHVRWVLE